MTDTAARPGRISSKHLLGTTVRDPDGERLGQVEEILMDLNDGFVTSFIMVTRNEEGANKRIAVPYDMIEVRANGEIGLGVNGEFLQRIPECAGESE
jgi:sporulation protein YlmC with PRC-barrel domain